MGFYSFCHYFLFLPSGSPNEYICCNWNKRNKSIKPPPPKFSYNNSLIGHVWYINILIWLRAFTVKNLNFLSFVSQFPQETWYKENNTGEEGGVMIWSDVHFNEEWNKQDKTGIFRLNSLKTIHNRFPWSWGYTEVGQWTTDISMEKGMLFMSDQVTIVLFAHLID